MIGSIHGRVICIDGLTALIECAGVGYEVNIPGNLLTELKPGEECFLFTHHVVREDAQVLYGFKSKEARLLFREIIKVNGIGPRIGMAILSVFDLQKFVSAVKNNKIEELVAVPGVGKKTAERLMMDMKDRLVKLRLYERVLGATSLIIEGDEIDDAMVAAQKDSFARDDAIEALISLGYKENNVLTAVRDVFKEGMTSEQIIVAGLAVLSKK